jgi:hypothetical protein
MNTYFILGGNVMEIELGEIQEQFAEIIWENEPVASGGACKDCTGEIVVEKINDIYSAKSHKFVDENFKGSLPSFIAAFAGGRKFSKKEVDEIQKMIDTFREGE